MAPVDDVKAVIVPSMTTPTGSAVRTIRTGWPMAKGFPVWTVSDLVPVPTEIDVVDVAV